MSQRKKVKKNDFGDVNYSAVCLTLSFRCVNKIYIDKYTCASAFYTIR